jgi:hypothetical protein
MRRGFPQSRHSENKNKLKATPADVGKLNKFKRLAKKNYPFFGRMRLVLFKFLPESIFA